MEAKSEESYFLMESTDFWGRLEDPEGWIVLLDSGVDEKTRRNYLELESGCIGCILVFSCFFEYCLYMLFVVI